MVRDKDQALGKSSLSMAQAAKDALGWITDNAKLVGPARSGLERSLKTHIVEANRLATAAVRPMSAAVFGPSQAGKSFLIGKFITPTERPARVVFGEGAEREELDFLSQVNPQGGKETTGLVTRFSITPYPTPPGFPVVLRLLREVDLVKILANSFLFDLSGTYEPRDPLHVSWIDRMVDELEPQAGRTPAPGLRMEDVLELREYFEESLTAHPYMQIPELAEAYWPAMERLLPLLSGPARVRALSPLWGNLPEFDGLFTELKGALDQLAHSTVAFAQMESIRDTSAGVLHVDRIYELAQSSGPGAQIVRLALADRTQVSLRKSVVTALTSELRVTLDRAPWPFLEHTDLLDFPGARSREDKTPEKYLRRDVKAGERPPRENCLLRGKVAVLFDNYVADLDLNTMMLCIPDSNMEVAKLPELVGGWIVKTHGATPRERARRSTSLLFCMTKCDRLFDLAAGAGMDQQIENRFDTNFRSFPGWTTEWHPNRPFDNSFMLRNPKAVEQQSIFVYDGPPTDRVVRDEAALTPDFENRLLPAFRKALAENHLVRTHVSDLDQKVDAMMAFNDGGVSHLAEALAPVCAPDLKYDQIRPRAEALALELSAKLSTYFDKDDIKERLDRRTARAMEAFRALGASGQPIGLFLQELGVEELALRQAYFDFARRDRNAAKPANAPAAKPPADDFGIDFDALGGSGGSAATAAPVQAAPRRETYGSAAIARWLDGLLRKTGDTALTSYFGLTPEQFQTFADELESGARRLRLIERIDAHTDKVIGYRQSPAATAAAVALGTSLIINDFVSDAGRRLMEEAPDADIAAQARSAFTAVRPLSPGDMPDLPADEASLSALRRQFPTEWARAFLALTRENASSSAGQLVDPEQNARLGAILDAFRL
ncbi:virulence factor SrfC family protein [Azospirillum sp. SYSU D00513]|uniref:virulence factor SrfC family protein n=1 Tax=Azospirillum sp. SYSU D00513 TaxID=2812561 RepID=UPI001A966C0A|nr:virulence factor SrfC family protein [Azospirillum sp. SYSU D00513]